MRPALLMLLVLAGCGPGASTGNPDLKLDLVLSALLKDRVSELQISLVTNARTLDCLTVQQSCLDDQVTRDRFIKVQDANGAERLALRFPLNVKPSGSDSAQDVSVQGIPLGSGYALVIEAISLGAPTLVGSSCNYLEPITAGVNRRLLANPIRPLMTPVNCDPRIE